MKKHWILCRLRLGAQSPIFIYPVEMSHVRTAVYDQSITHKLSICAFQVMKASVFNHKVKDMKKQLHSYKRMTMQ